MTRRTLLQMSAMLLWLRQSGFSEERRLIEIGQLIDTLRTIPKIRAKVAHELNDSYPVPTKDALVVFFSAQSRLPPAKVFKLWPPNWIAWFSPKDGSLLRLEEHLPEYYGLSGRRDGPFAEWAPPEEWKTAGVVDSKVADLIASMNTLYPEWFEGKRPGVEAAKMFRVRFLELEQPLIGCYRHVAPDFFKWVGL